jgi:hypothetical protein
MRLYVANASASELCASLIDIKGLYSRNVSLFNNALPGAQRVYEKLLVYGREFPSM